MGSLGFYAIVEKTSINFATGNQHLALSATHIHLYSDVYLLLH